MSATFIFLMVVLKIPIFGLFYIVWWAVHATVEPEPSTGEDGGAKRPLSPHPRHPRPSPALPRHPRGPRRDPHGAPAHRPPPRVRPPVVARARRIERHES